MSDASWPEYPSWAPVMRPRPPWWGGHLQTAGARLAAPSKVSNYRDRSEYVLPLNDGTGDSLAGILFEPNEPLEVNSERENPIIILMHGLGGNSESYYVQSSTKNLLELGHRVLTIDFRGAGRSAKHADKIYHPGRTEDIAALVDAIDEETEQKLHRSGIVSVGFSLGASVLLKYLAEAEIRSPDSSIQEALDDSDKRERDSSSSILGAVAISAPLDLASTSKCLGRPSRWAYQKYLLHKMREQALDEAIELTPEERSAIKEAKSIWEFDANFTAERCGFDSVEEYYEAYSAGRTLDQIEVPVLLIYAGDDPFVPIDQYKKYDWGTLPLLLPMIADTGGHMGFLTNDVNGSWHDQLIDQYVRKLIGVA